MIRTTCLGAMALVLMACVAAEAWGQQPKNIRLEKIAGRWWLIDPMGQPFFAHGVTHLGSYTQRAKNAAPVARACRELGFNAYGYGCPRELKSELPYLEGRNLVPMSLYRTSDGSFRYVDIFDPKERDALDAAVKKLCFGNRKNPQLIGYCWTDLGAWPLKNPTGTNWVQFIRDLPAEAPGRKAYREFLANSGGVNEAERDLAFLRVIAREYFGVLGKANRKYDPDHLIFGDRFTLVTAIPEVVEEMLPYVDAIAIQPNFQPSFPKQGFDRIHRMTGKPIIICDFAIRFRDGDKKVRGWKPQETPGIAGKHYADYIRQAAATPYVIGAFWCNPVDSQPGFKKQGIKQGLFAPGLVARPELNEAIRQLNQFLEQKTRDARANSK